MAKAGRVAMIPKGDYDSATTYQNLDVVRYENDIYVAKKASTGVLPTNTDYWMLCMENVTQEQYDALVNGTTPVGNALQLNGLTDMDFMRAMTPGRMREMGFDSDLEVYVSIDGTKYQIPFGMGRDNVKANTVGDYHASDLMKFVGTVDASYINAYVAKNPYLAHIIPDTAVAVGLPSQYYRVQFIPDTSNNYGTEIAFPVYGGSPYFRVCDNGVWKPWSTEFLPLTGGRIERSAYEPLEIGNTTGDLVALAFYGIGEKLGAFGFYGKDRPSFFTANGSQKDLLHTGNSLKVQASNDAPTDTATMWYDTANKTWKRYVDGAWQV